MRGALPALMLAAVVVAGCGGGGDAAPPQPPIDPTEQLAGGAATVFDVSNDAFGFPAPNLSAERSDRFFVGNSFFRTNWVTAPSSTEGRDGLGPLFNARSCSTCHLRDGRGTPPQTPEERPSALLFKIALPAHGTAGAPVPDPVYGPQFQTSAILDVAAEGTVRVSYEEQPGLFADGTPFSLRRPRYDVAELAYGPLAEGAVLAPRLAPAVFGLGLVSLVDEADVLERADPDDLDGDGISGRPSYVPRTGAEGTSLGRFGWKAEQPTIEGQSSGAFQQDIGITSALRPDEACTGAQTDCLAAPTGGTPEAEEEVLDPLFFYMHTLAVPARRAHDDAQVRRGQQVFHALGCAGCHVPTHDTGSSTAFPELSAQRIHPYTDLLLHDMGPELADGRAVFEASASEWRTPPLWGIGLTATVNGAGTFLLHDGRARDLSEAILWHAGEAQAARDAFVATPVDDRAALRRFVEDL